MPGISPGFGEDGDAGGVEIGGALGCGGHGAHRPGGVRA